MILTNNDNEDEYNASVRAINRDISNNGDIAEELSNVSDSLNSTVAEILVSIYSGIEKAEAKLTFLESAVKELKS